ncbi:sensor domain-containing diguanylate cyclase [Caldanaerobius fijiensis]|uniref:sensor domain-containing diguanylate cyclase n=1 Tax=Caldanaerobius fijiensis TaxID=456330 RepID=UPI0013563F6D|nr:sensor domain-containing diguanylate cyclase [Caldanaerobius fijiensis]
MKNKSAFAGVMGVGYALLFYFLLVYGIDEMNYGAFAAFTIVYIIVEHFGIKSDGVDFNLTSVFALAMFLMYGIVPTLLMAFIGVMVYYAVYKRKMLLSLFYGSKVSIIYSLSAMAFYLAGAHIGKFYSGQLKGILAFVIANRLAEDILCYVEYVLFNRHVHLDHFFGSEKLKALIGLISIPCALLIANVYFDMTTFYFLSMLAAILLLAYNFHTLSNLMYANKKLQALYNMVSIINSRLDVHQVGEAIIDAIREVVNFSGIVIFLKRNDMDDLEIVAWDIGDQDRYCDMKVMMDKRFVEYVLHMEEPTIIDCLDDKNGFCCDYFDFNSCMVVPLQQDMETIGAIILFQDYENSFTQDNLKIVSMISKQAAIALFNAKLYREMTQKSIMDPMTKLYNRRYFTDVLNDVIEICKKEGLNVSLIMIDIDYFKRVNDTYGHLIGDDVLKELANRIKMCLRNDDIVARYGGEEFVVVLPAVDEKQAYNIAERIRVEIESKPFNTRIGELNITVSAGVCEYPAKADSLERLIANADRALYMAKAGGRNRVVIYEHI